MNADASTLDELPVATDAPTDEQQIEQAPPEANLSELPGADEQAYPDSGQYQEEPKGQQEALGAITADPQDLHRYMTSRINGASHEEALKVGDHGLGTWGDNLATYKIPMVELPSDTPGIEPGRLVKVNGPDGSVIAKLAGVMPPTDQLKQNGTDVGIHVNPAAAMAVGHSGGVVPLKWEWAGDKGDTGQTPILNQLPQTMSAKQQIGSLGLDPNAKFEGMNPDGTKRYSDGWNLSPKDGVMYKIDEVQNQKVWLDRNGDTRIEALPKKKDLGEEAALAAAKKGVLREDFPEGTEGEAAYKKARSDALTASRSGVGTDPSAIADAIISGDQPPTLSGLYGRSGAVRTELAKKKYPLAEATMDWEAMKRHVASLNGPQQLRLRQATEFVRETVPLVRELSSNVSAAVPRGQFPIFNAAALAASRQGTFGKDAQNAATKLTAQIADMQSELAIMYSGGNSSTDAKLQQAHQMLSGNWSENQLNAALDLIETNSQLRLNSIKNTGVQSLTGENRYTPAGAPTPQPASTPAGTPSATPAATPVDPQTAISSAQRRLQANPNDEKAKAVLQRAKDLGLIQ